ncbi:hypothetical protein RN001_000177, partial [Aquatica leii]
WKDLNLQQRWYQFKQTILTTAKENCGTITINKNKKQTRWWNQEIKDQVKNKKKKWNLYLTNKITENYTVYKQQRIKVKEM